jgi:predicted 3-demethylubiquinone-9 3-methyltransferase (glyoxalase superfamily)
LLRDRYGVSWQIVPRMLAELLKDPDAGVRQLVTVAMLSTIKLDIETFEKAGDNG